MITICGFLARAEQDGISVVAGNADSFAGLLEEEAALTVVMLHAENRELKERVAQQDSEIEDLQRKLAEAMAGLDLGKIESGQRKRVAIASRSKVSLDDLTRLRVLDVNRQMNVVVISGGLRAGMKVGMMFSVVRNDKAIAEIRLVDVRERIAGGLIEKVVSGRIPESGDRLVLRETQY